MSQSGLPYATEGQARPDLPIYIGDEAIPRLLDYCRTGGLGRFMLVSDRNTYAVLPRHSLLFRPGTVQVCVLPPIDVTAWRIENLDRHVADVRALFQCVLDDDPNPVPTGG